MVTCVIWEVKEVHPEYRIFDTILASLPSVEAAPPRRTNERRPGCRPAPPLGFVVQKTTANPSQSDRRGSLASEAEIVAAIDRQPVVHGSDCANAGHHCGGIAGNIPDRFQRGKVAKSWQSRSIVEPVPEDIEVLYDLVLERPLVAKVMNFQAGWKGYCRGGLVSRDAEVVLATEPKW
jgi:hypothetical protein